MNTHSIVSTAVAGIVVTGLAGSASATTEPPEPSGVDAEFGFTGNVNPGGHDRFYNVVEGSDGALYASGWVDAGDGDHAFAVAKLGADGSVDETFGEGGSAVVNVVEGGGGAEVARGLVVGEDGSVTVGGPVEHDPTAEPPDDSDTDAAVVRLDPSGALDDSFGDGGIAIVDFGPGKAIDEETYVGDDSWGLAARDGGYVIFGTAANQEADRTDADWVIAALTDSGELDESFGDGGLAVADIDAAGDNARHVRVDDEGRILAAGYRRDGDGVVSPALIRLDPDGTFDESFGDGGVANHFVLDAVSEAYDVAFQGDAYVLTGYGRSADDETVDQITFRFTADGAWDESFGDGGVTRIDIAGEDDRGRTLAVLPDGGVVVAGSGKLDGTNLDGLITRLDADGAPVADFGDGGALLVDLGGPDDAFFGVTVAADGSAVYAAGYLGGGDAGEDDSVVVRVPVD